MKVHHTKIHDASWFGQSEHRRSTFGRRSEWINTSQNKEELCFSRGPRTRQAHCSTTVTAVHPRHLTCISENEDEDRCEDEDKLRKPGTQPADRKHPYDKQSYYGCYIYRLIHCCVMTLVIKCSLVLVILTNISTFWEICQGHQWTLRS